MSLARIKDAGIAIRHSRGRILFYTAGSRNELKGVDTGGHRVALDTKRKLYPRKIHLFVIEKSIEDVKQNDKRVPDLLEAIMRPTDPVKEELRRTLCNVTKFRPEIISKIRVCTFQMFGKIPDSANVAFKAVTLTHPHPFFAIFGRASGQIFEKSNLLAPFTLVQSWVRTKLR